MVRLQHLRPHTVEVGRACIHPEYRTGTVIMLLWRIETRYARHFFGVIRDAMSPVKAPLGA